MNADAVLGIDLGTSVVKAGIYGFDGVMHASATCPLRLTISGPGRAEQDLDDFYAAAAAATRSCLAGGFAPERIGAVAMAGQMAGVGIVDKDHRPLAAFDSWLDTRCGDIVDELSRTLGDRIAATAGCAPTISIGPKMLWWRGHRPDVCRDAASFVTAAGYVAGRATATAGRAAFIDPSYLHFTSVADVGRAAWDEALVDAVGVDPDLLPRILESAEIVGALTDRAAADFGLRPGVPVAAGCGDTAASALGAGTVRAGQAFDIAGTAAVFGLCLPVFAPDAAEGTLMTMRAALPGRWYSLAYVGGAGQVVEWVCREVLGHPSVGPDAYADLEAAASSVPPGSDGVMLSPHFSGRVAPVSPSMRGSIVGLSAVTGRAHLARAALEAIAYEYRRYADIARAVTPSVAVTEIIGTGGGSRLDVWNQIKADVLATPYRPVVGAESGTRGAAVVAMAAIGQELPELEPSAYGPVARPDPATVTAYAAAVESYRRWSARWADGYRTESALSEQHGTGEII
jgi:xylulokinase